MLMYPITLAKTASALVRALLALTKAEQITAMIPLAGSHRDADIFPSRNENILFTITGS